MPVHPDKLEGTRVEMQGISKRFGEVQALDRANFTLLPGEVHAILGENGAGKTTLMNVLSGLYRAEAGEILIKGKAVTIREPKDAIEYGIGMVHQHFELIQNFSALENIVIGKEGDGRILDLAAQKRQIEFLMERYGLSVDLDQKVKNLAIGVQQKVEILKVLYHGAEILILDEPTTMLTPQEVDRLFEVIRSLVEQQLSVVIITHKIKEVLTISNRITIMRRGQVVITLPTVEATQLRLVELMMGEKKQTAHEDFIVQQTRVKSQAVAVSVDSLGVRNEVGNWAVREVTLEIREGEIVGLVGVAGNGQREVAEALLGLKPVTEGQIFIKGRNLTQASIRERLLAGIVLIPEDRIRQGILPALSLAQNLILGPHHTLFGKSIKYKANEVNSLAARAIEEYQIQAPNEQVECRFLSGGNIQKVIVARAFLQSTLIPPVMMIAFNPTRGIDVMSSRFIHQKLGEFRSLGRSVLLISEDLDESMALCDRIYVLYKGRVTAEFTKEQFDPYQIGAFMSVGQQETSAV